MSACGALCSGPSNLWIRRHSAHGWRATGVAPGIAAGTGDCYSSGNSDCRKAGCFSGFERLIMIVIYSLLTLIYSLIERLPLATAFAVAFFMPASFIVTPLFQDR